MIFSRVILQRGFGWMAGVPAAAYACGLAVG